MNNGTLQNEVAKRGRALRDNHGIKDFAYWLEQYNFVEKTFEYMRRAQDSYRHNLSKGFDRSEALADLYRRDTETGMCCITVRYTTGCELDAIRTQSLLPALENGIFFRGEVDAHSDEVGGKCFYSANIGFRDSDVYDVYTFLSWCVCLDADPEVMKQLAPVIAPSGVDRLFDVVLQAYDPDREIAPGPKLPKIFGQLNKVIDASPAQRIKLMERHLDKWAVTISKCKGVSGLGGTGGLKGAKSNADLSTERFIKPNYWGWWSWETALMVRVFGIDDTSFAEHPLYPVELARYRNADVPVSPWPLGGKSSSTAEPSAAEVDLEEDGGVLKTLLVVVSIAAGGDPTWSLVIGDSAAAPEDQDDSGAGFLYYAVDKDSVDTYGDPPEIITGSSDLEFSALVLTEEKDVTFNRGEIERVSGYLDGYTDRYSSFKNEVEDGNVQTLVAAAAPKGESGVLLPISSGDNWASWLDAGKLPSGKYTMSVIYARVQDGTLLKIVGSNNGRDDVDVGEVVNEVERLVQMHAGHAW